MFEGITLYMYVAIASMYPLGWGITGWYQSLASHIFSTSSRQINEKIICNWNTWVTVYNPTASTKVICSFLIIFSLNPETLLSFHFLVFRHLLPTQIWKDKEIVMVLALLEMVLVRECRSDENSTEYDEKST